MVFTADSYLVKIWVGKVKDGSVTKEDVPNLYNLREVVYSLV